MRLLVLLLVMACVPGNAAAQFSEDTRPRAIVEHAGRLVPFGFSGAVVVQEGDAILLAEGFGLADRNEGRPMTPDTPMPIGSLSKQFTATTVLALAEDGVLSIHDPVGQWLPSAPDPLASATIQQLLRHRSGLPYHTNRNFAEALDRSAVVEEMLGLELDFEPGARSGYSNPGYTLLAAIVEAATGRSFEDVMEERVLQPAGLEATGSLFDERWTGSAVGYQDDIDEGPAASYGAMGKALGAASVVSSARDLVRWLSAVEEGRVLGAPWVDSLFTPSAGPNPGPFGMGWIVTRTERGTPARLHPGDLGPFNTMATTYPEEDRIVVILSNTRLAGRGTRDAVSLAVGRILAGATPTLPPLVATNVPPIDSAAFGTAEDGGALWRRRSDFSLSLRGGARAAFDAIPVADSARYRVEDDTRTVISGLASGDFEVLSRFAHPAMSWQGLAQRERDAAVASGIDELTEIRVRVPVATGAEAWRTVAEAHSAARSWARAVVWDRGGLLDVRPVDPGEPEFSLWPEAGVPGIGLVSYDLFTGRTVRLRADGADAVIDAGGEELWRAPITAVHQTNPAAANCNTPEHRAFDFWIGEWEVSPNDDSGTVLGSNSIRAEQNGCVIVEVWTGRGSTGTSLNFYSPATGRWHQQWVSPQNAITLAGEASADGVMRMEGVLHDARTGRSQPFRGSWTLRPDGTVRQLFELITPEDREWTVWFDGIYRRVEPSGRDLPQEGEG